MERERAADLPPVPASANALRQVFLNLLSNALQAMPHGGRLRCATRFHPRARRVEVRIADTGPGISAEDSRHLFEPFFTTRPEGTGLGLALCREIVSGHGGVIVISGHPHDFIFERTFHAQSVRRRRGGQEHRTEKTAEPTHQILP